MLSAAPDAVAGRYLLEGPVRLEGTPFDREVSLRADAVVAPAGGRALRVRLESEGQACDLEARLGADGGLAFAPGQACEAVIDAPAAKGRVSARLRSGAGRIGGGRLAVELVFELAGAVRLGSGALEVLGGVVSVPGALAPEVPVKGTARAAAEGARLVPGGR